MATERMIEELLISGAEDWITASEVAWVAKSVGGASTDEEVLAISLNLIQAAVEQGLMEVGDVTDGGFIPWDLPPLDAVRRVEGAWRDLGRLPNLGEVCWLANTTNGDRLAKQVLDHQHDSEQ